MTLEMAHRVETRYSTNSGSIGKLFDLCSGGGFDSNRGWNTDYPESRVSWFTSVLQVSRRCRPANEVTTAFFPISSYTLCDDHRTIDAM
jgi:hypothetical protein